VTRRLAISGDGDDVPKGEVFELGRCNVIPYLVGRGVLSGEVQASVVALAGGVSATVLAVRAPGTEVVVKQALWQLKVDDDWTAKQERTELEAAAMRLCDKLTPGRVPLVLDADASSHVVVMELLPDDARNWQSEIAAGRAHAEVGAWAGETLGLWHAQTVGDSDVAEAFDDFESFEQLRLSPFYETVIERLPEVADDIAVRLEELRERRCFVDGDFAMKNMLVGPAGSWVLDFEVAHYGNPIFDLGFFLSFVVLSAVRWASLTSELRTLADGFLSGYDDAAGAGFAGDLTSVTAHTAALMLARTDGKSPAQFLDPQSRVRAREAGIMLLRRPDQGLWQWL
jgi:Phosphotransferase enzyme family